MTLDHSDITRLENSVVRADLKTGRGIITELTEKYGYEVLISQALEPLLTTLGERLKRQEASLAQTYVASLMVEEVLHLYKNSPQHQENQVLKGPVVLANIEDDCHPLGRKIIATLLMVHQWKVYDLGIDVEARTIVDQALRVNAPIIGVSAMTYTTAENILKVRQEIEKRGFENRIQLAVGGAVFRLRPELAKQVGADGTAPNAFSALLLFDQLCQHTGGDQP